MIEGLPTNSNMAVIAALQNSEHQFYLTGSRYFGDHGENSDWDFFIDSGKYQKVAPFLRSLGFHPMGEEYRENSSYRDVNTHEVWRWESSTQSSVDVSFTHSIQRKLRVVAALKGHPRAYQAILGNYKSSPDLRRDVWNFLYDLQAHQETTPLGAPNRK